MNTSTAVTATPPPAAPPEPETGERSPRSASKPLYIRLLEPLASLRITVVLFVLSIFLVFCGTLAQVDEGIWFVVGKYFRSAMVWVPLQIFFPRPTPDGGGIEVSGSFPYPGGWLLGGLLLVNLLAAHTVRFRVSWKRSGILLIHAGLIVMMLSELITGLMAVEGNMSIPERGDSNYVEDVHHSELALVRAVDAKSDDVVVVPDRILQAGQLVQHGLLPCDVWINQYMVNSDVGPIPADFKNLATKGAGLSEAARAKPAVTGVGGNSDVDIPSAYVTLKKKGTDEELGTYLVSNHLPPQRVRLGDEVYELSLRPKRTYKPYTVRAEEVSTEYYPGTARGGLPKPKSYSSQVVLTDPSRGEKREALISMNNPLRYAGETFFQSMMRVIEGPDGRPLEVTVLQVVRNPGWLMPYLSCIMVSVGMIIHFGLHLTKFLEQRGRAIA